MRQRTWKSLCFCLLVVTAVPATALAGGPQYYDVTITNLTRGQIMSPPVVVSHDASISLFELGEPASDELAALAEDADNTGLVALLSSSSAVRDVEQGDGAIMPGASTTVRIQAGGSKRLISFASMLVSTNDSFAAARALNPTRSRAVTTVVPAYDAGSEDNSELCLFIPGPPCGNRFQRDTANAEGYVYVNPGIQGVGDLEGDKDWRNPVARVAVVPVGPPSGDDDDDDDDDEN